MRPRGMLYDHTEEIHETYAKNGLCKVKLTTKNKMQRKSAKNANSHVC